MHALQSTHLHAPGLPVRLVARKVDLKKGLQLLGLARGVLSL